MLKKLEEVVNLEIPAGGAPFASERFTPQAGLVIGCVVFTNNASTDGTIVAKITTDSGDVISPATDIRNYRSREAGYKEGCKPLYFETNGRTLVFEVGCDAEFYDNFKCQLVLIYENNFAQEC